MARKPKKIGQSEANFESVDRSVTEVAEPKEHERTDRKPEVKNLSPGEAAELMQGAVIGMGQQWLQSAVTIANVLKNGQPVHRGTFEDLRQARENYEELERARLHLQNLQPPANPIVEEAKTALSKGELDEEALVI